MTVLKHLRHLLLVATAFPISLYLRLVRHPGQEIWLVGERKDQACDNGYHFFKFVRERHPARPVYYVIQRGSRDAEKVRNYGNILFYGELQHYVYWVAARRLACAHLGSCVPDNAVCWVVDRILRTYFRRKRIFLQHGITKELLPPLFYDRTRVDLYVCGAAPEADFVASQFGYPEGSVRHLGFPRFDTLHDFTIKKQILVMPTWRKWLPVGSTWGKINEASLNLFLISHYYQNYKALLNHQSLHLLLEETGYRLIFYPHHEMQTVAHLFPSTCTKITIARNSEFDVQQLLKESAVLVTDYSSVAFDFAYMRKPVIYFQFDREEYDQGHYAKGYFDYDRDGFGPVVVTSEHVVAQVKAVVQSDVAGHKQEYLRRQEAFFKLHDAHNCERTFQAIQSI
jgi:CDP-glycerol glycerophosphotransferase